MTPFEILRDDPRTWEAIDRLLERGMDEAFILPMLRSVANIPPVWKSLNTEPPEKRKKRRATLARKVRVLASELGQDIEAKHIRIVDGKSISQSPLPNSAPLHEYLREIANHIETRKTHDDVYYGEFLTGKSTTRMSLKDFAKREIFWLLDEWLDYPKTPPRKEARSLCTVLLGPKMTVTEAQMKMVKRQNVKIRPRHNSHLSALLSRGW